VNLRLCKRPSQDGLNDAHDWFDRDKGLRISDEEVAALEGTEDRWVATYADGSTAEAISTFTARGFLNASDRWVIEEIKKGSKPAGNYYPKPTSLRAAKFDLTSARKELRTIVGPRGETPDIVRIRFVSGEVSSQIGHEWVFEEVLDEKELYGANLCSGHVINGWTYGFGALRHLQDVHKAAGIRDYYKFTEEERDRASMASSRACLGILRHFKLLFPVRRFEWIWAAKESGVEVQRQVNDGPWCVLDAKGKPTTTKEAS
jgi:hypothetical protein